MSNKYTIEINGHLFCDFKRKDTWNGFTEYSGPSGTIIVDEPVNGLSGLIGRFFPFDQGVRQPPEVYRIAKATPRLLSHIKDAPDSQAKVLPSVLKKP